MPFVDDQQLIRAWDSFKDNGFRMKDSQGEIVDMETADSRRRERIPTLNTLMDEFVEGNRALGDFKSEIDGQNKRFPYWGFKGMNGMMFFNMLYTSAGEERRGELSELLQNVIRPPDGKMEAKDKIRALEGFVERLRNEVDDLRKAPRPGSIPYFLSYFWQIRDPDRYPIYYTSMVNALSDLAIWEPKDDLGDSYGEFWDLNEAMRDTLAEHTGRDIHLWTVEHVFWYWQQREEFEEEKEPPPEAAAKTLPDSYIPPIVSILPDLAEKRQGVAELAEETGNAVETLFENRLSKCLEMIGFEVDELGQGVGRAPDGIAKDHLHNYAIIYDAKVRQDGYSMNTGDERQFQDYINREVPTLRSQGFRNIYFTVISGTFTDESRETIRALKMSTDIQEVRLVEVDALLAILENRLRDPRFSLGPGDVSGPGIQDFFAESGILSAVDIREELGI